MPVKYTAEIISTIAMKVAKDLIAENSGMQNYMLMDVIDALEKGESIDDSLLSKILTRPFMDRLIDELLKYEEE